MTQLSALANWLGKYRATILCVWVAIGFLTMVDAQASPLETTMIAETVKQVAMLGEPVREGDLGANRGAGLDAPAPNTSVPSSGGLAVILWDEPGQGKLGGVTGTSTGHVIVNGTVLSK